MSKREIRFGEKAQKQIEALSKNIDNLYLVGGIVRDFYLYGKHTTDDIDLTTDLPLDGLKKRITTRFFQPGNDSTICINAGDRVIEITPFKGKSLSEDLKNRDLTINAIAIPFVGGALDYDNRVDEVGGFRDIQYKVLRTTREQNFIDDPLRIIRLFRFQSKLGFDIENLTWCYALNNKHLLKVVARERIKKEFNGILMGSYAHMALRNMLHMGILGELFEEVKPMMDFLHCDKHHFNESIIEHTIRVVQGTPRKIPLRLAAFFHDFGKPAVFDAQKGHHYLGHEEKSSKMAEKILFDNRYDKKTIQNVKTLIKFHDVSVEAKSKFNEIYFYHGERLFKQLIELILADKKATLADFDSFEQKLMAKSEKTLSFAPIFKEMAQKIRGQFLLDLGLTPNSGFRKITDFLQHKFLKNPVTFNEETLFKAAGELLHFRGDYRQLSYKKKRYLRLKEVLKESVIYGVLKENQELGFNSVLFEYQYMTDSAFEKMDKTGAELFYHPSKETPPTPKKKN